jgi:hypothetical protein
MKTAFHRMEPAGAERHVRADREIERAGLSESNDHTSGYLLPGLTAGIFARSGGRLSAG